MLRKDKALIEGLTRKYGKRNIINETNLLGMGSLTRNKKKIINKIEKNICSIFDNYGVDIISLIEMKGIKPLFIEKDNKNYKVKIVLRDFDEIVFVTVDKKEITLESIEDISELLFISEWVEVNKEDIIFNIENDIKMYRTF